MTKKKRVVPPRILERVHGRYLIKAGVLHDTFVARAFPKPPSKFRHLVAEATGKSAEEAIDHLIVRLKTLHSERRTQRRPDPALPSGVPTIEEYADALRSVSPTGKVLHALHEHALSRRRGLPLGDLVKSGDFRSLQDFLKAYDKLGLQIATEIEPDDLPDTGLPVVTVLPDQIERSPDEIAVLQPELQAALIDLLGEERKAG